MARAAFEKLKRYSKLSALANVVLLDNLNAERSRSHLEMKLHQRLDKEFLSPNSEEAEIIASIKEENLHFVERIIKQHNNGDFFVQVKQNVREKDVHLFHKFSDNNLSSMELFTICDALKRSGVRSITLYVPYIPFQRQDKKDDGRVPITAKLFFDTLNASAGKYLKRIVTFDLHARQAQAHFDGPMDELSAMPEFAAYHRKSLDEELKKKQVLVVSPDAGGAKRSEYVASLLGVNYTVLDKKRTGHGKATTKYHLPQEIEGKIVIIVDETVDSASSVAGEEENKLPGPIQYLYSRGAAEVHLSATHHELSVKNGIPAETRLRNSGVQAIFTDSLPEKYDGYYEDNKDWMKVLSLNYALARAFYCNQVGESISDFFVSREKKLKAKNLDFLVTGGDAGIVSVE